MPVQKINKTLCQNAPFPTSGQVFYRDTDLKGFALRVTPGSKTFIVERWSKAEAKSIRTSIGKFPSTSADAARQIAIQLLSEITKGENPNEKKREQRRKARIEAISLRVVWADYKKSRDLRAETIRIYENSLFRYFREWLDLPIDSINADMVTAKYFEIISPDNRGQRSAKDGAKAQGHQAIRVLRSLMNFARVMYHKDDGLPVITTNPVEKLVRGKLLKRVQSRKGHIKKHQLGRWLRAVMRLDNDTIRDFLLICLFTGLRKNEAAALSWSEVDFRGRTLVVPGCRSKTKVEHVLPLSDVVQAILSGRVRRLDNPYVFPGNGKKGHLIEPKASIKKVCEWASIDGDPVSFITHDLRRTFISIAEASDVPFLAMKRLANHAASDITAQYAQISLERLREPMQRISDAILESAEIDKDEFLSTWRKGKKHNPVRAMHPELG